MYKKTEPYKILIIEDITPYIPYNLEMMCLNQTIEGYQYENTEGKNWIWLFYQNIN